MIAIAIMALLTGIITVNLTKSRGKARDAKRVSDIGQLQLALELYFDRCNKYPASAVVSGQPTIDVASSCTTQSGAVITINTFITNIPTPGTQAGQVVYRYGTNTAPATDYVLMTVLEGYSEVVKDDLDGTVFSQNCGTANNGQGTAEVHYCVGPQ